MRHGGNYFLKRAGLAVPTLFAISLLYFALVHLTPGGPVEQRLASWRGHQGVSHGNFGGVTRAQRELLREHFGFDRPLVSRYFHWIGQVLRLDLGHSYHYEEPVSALIWQRLPVSLTFGLVSFVLTYFIGIPLGAWKALRHGSRFDILTSAVLLALYSIPPFALGVFCLVIFAGGSLLQIFPVGGSTVENFADLSPAGKLLDFVHHLILPTLCYTVGGLATTTLLVKSSVREQLGLDYLLAVRAKGVSESRLLWRHALRNALLPVLSGLGNWLAIFLAGSVLIETVFNLPGIGRLSFDALVQRDYPVVLAILLLFSVTRVAGNLVSDYLVAAADPRIELA